MSKYLIDTNICIEYFKKRNGVPERMSLVNFEDIYVSEITIAELLYGAVHSKSVERHLREVRELQRIINVLPISNVLADYAEIRHDLSTKGLIVEDFDMLIGATARHYNLIVVTDNQKHFLRMPGISAENWVERKS